MKLIKPSFLIEECLGLSLIERAGRTCYKSEHKMHANSSAAFVRNLINSKHDAIIEHSLLSVRLVIDRGVSHEIVRHRPPSFAQESTRYCNYFSGVTFIIPPWTHGFKEGEYNSEWELTKGLDVNNSADIMWAMSMLHAERTYVQLLSKGWSPQQARSVLPNSLKTEIVITTNFREWRHILELRALGTTGKPHPQMLEIMIPLLAEVKKRVPIVFDDLEVSNET